MRIALLHHTGSGNLGDQASVDAVIGNIRRRWPDSTIGLLSMNPSETARIHGVPSYPLRSYTWEVGYTSAAREPNSVRRISFYALAANNQNTGGSSAKGSFP